MNTKRYRTVLFALLSKLAKYLLIGGLIGTLLLGFLNRTMILNNGLDGLIGGLLAYFIIGCFFGILIFCFKGIGSDGMAFLGGQFLFATPLGLFGGTGGFMWFVLFMVKILFYTFQGLVLMPILIVYLGIMSAIECFVEIPEAVGNITDHLPKIASIVLGFILILACLNAI